jgi:hypothetical protein
MKNYKGFMEVFEIFHITDSYFDEIDKNQSNRLIVNQIIVICAFTFIYGIVMGSYYSFLQSIVAGIKVTFLFMVSTIICFPSFFIIQQVLGSKMSVRQMTIIVLSGLMLTSSIIVAFTPIIILFQLTGGNYHFLQLLHVAIFLFGGIFGLRQMVDALKFAYEKKAIYPKIGVHVFRIWIIILAFVGIQLSWNLRPFLCNKTEEFKLFRKYEGNFYTAIVYSVEQLVSKKEEPKLVRFTNTEVQCDSTDLKNGKTDTITLHGSKKN